MSFLTLLLFFTLSGVFIYLLLAYSIRWFAAANDISNIKQYGSRSAISALRESRYRPVFFFIVEYLLYIVTFFVLFIDYILSMFHRFSLFLPSFDYVSSEKNPVILIHGFLMRGSTMQVIKRRLKKDGWENVYTFSYSPRAKGIKDISEQLKSTIEELEAITGGKKYDIISHSMGGLVALCYIKHFDGYEKIDKLITIGTPFRGSQLWCFSLLQAGREMMPGSDILKSLIPVPESVKVLSIYSLFDQMVIPNENAAIEIKNGRNIKVNNLGHLSLIFCRQVYSLIKQGLDNNG